MENEEIAVRITETGRTMDVVVLRTSAPSGSRLCSARACRACTAS